MSIYGRNKYGNKKTVIDGIQFDSGKEAKRYKELKYLELAGEISNLKMQVKFELIPKQTKADGKAERSVTYIADFTYEENGELVVEDVKSMITRKTPQYIIKRKLLLERHGITIREV